MAHNVVIKRATASLNVDSYNRTAVYTVALDNGSVFTLSRSSVNDQRWTAAAPTAATATGVWMATSPEVNYVDKSNGLSVDPRDFTNKAGKAIDAILLQKGDIIELTGEFAGTAITNIASKDYLMIDANSFVLKAADSSDLSTGLTLKKIGASTLHIGDGEIAPAAVATYVYEVTNN